MRILLVLEACGGGTGRHVADLARGLLARGHEVSLRYSPTRAEPWFLEEIAHCADLDAREISIGRSVSLNDFKAARRLRQTLASEPPYDIMHGHSSKAGAVLRLAQPGRHSPVVYTPHAPITMDPDMPFAKKALYLLAERMLSGWCRQIICVSPAEREHLLKLGFPASKLQVVCNGVGPQSEADRDAVRDRLRISPDKIVFGCVGRLSHQKATDRAVRAFAVAGVANPDLHLVIVGNGPDRAAVSALVADSGLADRVTLTGAASGAEMMAAFDAFLLPSRYEGMPYVLLEAAARRLPVIMTNVGGAHLVVRDHENGFVIPSYTDQKFADRMLQLAELPALRRKMAARSAAIAAEFSIDHMVEETLRVYAAARRA